LRKKGGFESLKLQKVNWVDMGVGIFSILLTVYIYVVTGSYPKAHINPVSAATFPRLLSSLIALAGLGLIYGAIKKGDAAKITLKNFKKVLLLIVLLIAYASVLEFVGFTLATIALMAAILFIFELKKVSYLVLVPIVATLIIQYIFQKVLNVPLPTGIFSLM
jgi:putative tricarboxylic transport membrane protein